MRIALACLLACLACMAQAQSNGVYKWKDANGASHYSVTPPPSGRFDNVEANASARVAAPAKPDARCAEARANAERIKNSAGEVGPDANGDGKPDRVLDAAEKARYLKAAEDQATKYCAAVKP